jgi:hypothetical protein
MDSVGHLCSATFGSDLHFKPKFAEIVLFDGICRAIQATQPYFGHEVNLAQLLGGREYGNFTEWDPKRDLGL